MNINIWQVQRLLRNLGHDPGEIDGIWGPKSQAALDAAEAEERTSFDNLVQTTLPEKPKTFWDDIRYMPRVEWRCPCGRCGGYPAEPQEKIVRFLEQLRVHFNRPVTISSGVRCQKHNDELPGSVSNSRHLSGKAVDFCVQGMSATAVKVYCDQQVKAGVLRYCYCIDESFVHADIL